MLTLRFRAWLPNKSRWWNNRRAWSLEDTAQLEEWSRDCSRDEFVVMQSTGLTDRNGVEIFEGDILEDADLDDQRDIVELGWWDRDGIGGYGFFVRGNGECFGIDELLIDNEAQAVAVVGNRYDNPELVKSVA